jgi:hypothetical protein
VVVKASKVLKSPLTIELHGLDGHMSKSVVCLSDTFVVGAGVDDVPALSIKFVDRGRLLVEVLAPFAVLDDGCKRWAGREALKEKGV